MENENGKSSSGVKRSGGAMAGVHEVGCGSVGTAVSRCLWCYWRVLLVVAEPGVLLGGACLA